jgi:hypothetical protein
MGLFDEYFASQQLPDSGGLLGRLLALQQQQGQDQPGASSDQAPSVPQAPGSMSMQSPMLANFGQTPSVQRAPAQDPRSQYAALAPVLGDHSAMIATADPGIGKTLIALALAGQQKSGKAGDADPSGVGHVGSGDEASSIAEGQPLGLSETAYRETSANANQVFGELSDIRARDERDTVSGEDYLSGVREGNIRRNGDGSLDVTNGSVVTLSLKDGRAKTVTVTNSDIARIDPKTGEVVIQKSPLGDGI